MKTAKHTPGPWAAKECTDFGDDNRKTITSASGRHIAYVARGNHESDEHYGVLSRVDEWRPIHEANAKLLAAAPALLEACKAALDVGEIRFKTCALSAAVHDVLRKAIQGAEGNGV